MTESKSTDYSTSNYTPGEDVPEPTELAEANPAELAVVPPVAPLEPVAPEDATHDPFLYLSSQQVDEDAIDSSEQGFGYLSSPAE